MERKNLAEKRGFEPLHPIKDLLAFQASPFSPLGTPPLKIIHSLFSIIYFNLLID